MMYHHKTLSAAELVERFVPHTATAIPPQLLPEITGAYWGDHVIFQKFDSKEGRFVFTDINGKRVPEAVVYLFNSADVADRLASNQVDMRMVAGRLDK